MIRALIVAIVGSDTDRWVKRRTALIEVPPVSRDS
jgi:hypothetical protein